MIARSKFNNPGLRSEIRSRMEDGHDHYYGKHGGCVVALDGRQYPLGYSVISDRYDRDKPDSFRWVTAGGNILEIITSISRGNAMIVIGRRHGIPWQFIPRRAARELDWELVDSQSEQPPWMSGDGTMELD